MNLPNLFKLRSGYRLAKQSPNSQKIKVVKRIAASAGWVETGGKRFYARSKMEANYGLYLQWLKDHKQILDWEHEPQCFWFESIKRGIRSYLPDFKVVELNGSHSWREVKGYMDANSKTKLSRFAKYYPKEKMIVISTREYQEIKKKVGRLIKGWL